MKPPCLMLAFLLAGAACAPATSAPPAAVAPASTPASAGVTPPSKKEIPAVGSTIQRTDEEWKKILTPEQYRVLRKEGTERAFTGETHDEHRPGVYSCAGCGAPLFSSAEKFDSGTGWPSFWQPIEDGRVATRVDKSFFSTRTEVHCARCAGHLGHVFEDGPKPTGLRYCMNSAAMTFSAGPTKP